MRATGEIFGGYGQALTEGNPTDDLEAPAIERIGAVRPERLRIPKLLMEA